MIGNRSVIEVPNRAKFREWIYINAYGYLEQFVQAYEMGENRGGEGSFGGGKRVLELFKNTHKKRK